MRGRPPRHIDKQGHPHWFEPAHQRPRQLRLARSFSNICHDTRARSPATPNSTLPRIPAMARTYRLPRCDSAADNRRTTSCRTFQLSQALSIRESQWELTALNSAPRTRGSGKIFCPRTPATCVISSGLAKYSSCPRCSRIQIGQPLPGSAAGKGGSNFVAA